MTPIKAAAEPSGEDQIRAILDEESDVDFDARRIDYGDAVARIARLAAPAGNDEVREALHPATSDLVQRFAVALATKLRAAEVKYGYSTGWRDDAWQEECRAGLMKHVMKGDPLDVAAFAAFCWDRHWSAAPMYPDHEDAFLPLFERWADAMLIGEPDREILRRDVQSALPQAREAFAEEIKRADAAPPEASFDNASDMLGYLNAPARAMTDSSSYPGTEQLPLSPEMVLTAAREVVTHLRSLNKPYSADVMADCISTIENLLTRPVAQRPMDRDEIAKRISFAHLGDDREWKGFRSHADRFLAYAPPSTHQLSPTPEEIAHAESLRGQDLYAWPIGCHSPNSCRRNGRCMYIGCEHDGTTVMTSTDGRTP